MRVIHTIARTRLDHGGTSRSVPATCEALGQLGIDVHLITARPADLSILCNLPRVHTTVHTAVESRWLRQWGVPRQFRAMLNTICSEQPPNLTILHDHGLWLASNHASAKYSSKFHLPRVVSPRGMLGQWSMNHSRSRKQIAWRVFQYQDLKRATAFHATSDQEADDIRRVGLQQPIAVIPNGFSMPQTLPIRKNTDGLQALFLSRVHPKKGLIPLIQAWKNANLPSTWRLVLAGPDEGGHAAQVTQEIRRLNLEKCVRLIGPVDDQEKWQLYADSDLFVLPSFHENFGIVIAEAMAAGLPVITTTATPWKALQEKRLGWWIPPTVEAIRIALVEACALSPESLKQIGANAAVYVSENYSWQKTALELRTFYESILSDYGTERQRGRLSHEAR